MRLLVPELTTRVAMQNLAEREAKKLGIEHEITVQWAGSSTCKLRRDTLAHAHVYDAKATGKALICVRRGIVDWRDTIKHEVAHFAPGGDRHDSIGYLRIRAVQGSRQAKAALVARGKMRCPKHIWLTRGQKDMRVTTAGLVITYAAVCARCDKEIGR